MRVLEKGLLDGGQLGNVVISAKRIGTGYAYYNKIERKEDPFSGPRGAEIRAWLAGQAIGHSINQDNPFTRAIYTGVEFYAEGAIGGALIGGLFRIGKGIYLGRGVGEVVTKGGAVIGTKLEYVFGKATGNAHDIERSTGMLNNFRA